jgi:hypothetical protein
VTLFIRFLYKMQIADSDRKGKRYVAIFKNGKRIHFGQPGGSTYIDHGDKDKRAAYLARHGAGREDWTDPYSAGALSRWILWGDYTSIHGNVAAFRRRFSV